MRIGILCHPTYGGSGVVASELALSLAERGHRVHLFSHDVPPRLARAPGPVEIHVAQGSPYPLFHSTPHDLAIMSRVLDLHRSEGLDVLHAHYALPHAVGALVVRAAAAADGVSAPIKVVTTLHGTDITLVGNDPSYAPLTQYAISSSDAVTAVSDDLARRTRDNFEGKPPCGIEVIPNFVDVNEFQPVEGPAPRPTAIHVSNFRRVKRVPWLVSAFARALELMGDAGREAELILVGDGPQLGEAKRVARDRGICDRVKFLGLRDALPALLSPADAFCLTSTEESFGLSALEAMACGTAVVGTRAGGLSEVVEHGSTGLLVDIEDAEGYAVQLASVLTDRDKAAAMGLAGRARAQAVFGRDRVVGAYEALYQRLITADGPCP